jgi:hypothetical protein
MRGPNIAKTQTPAYGIFEEESMLDIQRTLDRIGLVTALVSKAPRPPGRTSIMKWIYFLRTLRRVPLPYRFRLYTYGPFDSDVIDDLDYARFLGAVESTLVAYPGGRGYEYLPGPKAGEMERRANTFLTQHEEDIDWVLEEFGNRSAGNLEMSSTIVYVDRSLAERGMRSTFAELTRRVHAIKPHLSLDLIGDEARTLGERSLLKAVA